MRAGVLASLFVLAAPAAVGLGQDAAEESAFVELEASRATVYVGERFVITIRVGIDADFLATKAIQPFRRELDVPVKIEAPWFDEAEGVRRFVIHGQRAGTALKLALNEQVVGSQPGGKVARSGRTYSRFDIERGLVAERPGELTIPAPRLRLAYATQFEETFVEGRVPLDRHDVTVAGSPLTIDVLPLPGEGRPAAFCGAVGRFTTLAEADTDTVDVGGSLKLTLHVDGTGGWPPDYVPPLDDLDGLHVLGVIETGRKGGRTFTYDLSVLRPVPEIAAIPFTFFDPGPPAEYRTVRTAPIPLTVVGARADESAPRADGEEQDESFAISMVPTLIVTAIVLVLCHFLAFWWFLTRRARAARARAASPSHRIARALEAGGDPADELAAYLAAHLDCEPAAVISPDLPARLITAGIAAPLAERTSETLERLVAARYGGGAGDDAADVVRALVDELEAAFAART